MINYIKKERKKDNITN